MGLSKEQIARYSRQLILPELGVKGQERLLRSSVLLVGAGGLGSPAALYLAAAGVGTIGLIDPETVALSNLHRQILHTAEAVGRAKTLSAAARLAAIDPGIAVRPIQARLSPENAPAHLAGYDLVLDGSDNIPTRYLVNDACVLAGTPMIHGAAVAFGGQLMTILPKRSACFRCVFPESPLPDGIPNCQDAGVLGSVVGILGSLMAHEALKHLAGIGEPLADRLLVFEGRSSRFREVPLRRDRGCAVCGDAPAIHELTERDEPTCRNGQRTEDSSPRSEYANRSDLCSLDQ